MASLGAGISGISNIEFQISNYKSQLPTFRFHSIPRGSFRSAAISASNDSNGSRISATGMKSAFALRDEDSAATFRIDKDGGPWLRMTVEDHGAGIPAPVRERIFDPFYTTKPAGMGTGLGLSISHGIVKDHGGELHFETEPGHGTRFHVDLPVAALTQASRAGRDWL